MTDVDVHYLGRSIVVSRVSRSLHEHFDDSERTPGSRSSTASCYISFDDAARKEAFYGKDLIVADRDLVETGSDEILKGADQDDVSLLVVGDPFG